MASKEIPSLGEVPVVLRVLDSMVFPRGSRYLIIKELGLKDHDYCGFWGLSPE